MSQHTTEFRVKLLVPHKADCIALKQDWGHPWAYFLEEALYLDSIGRKTRSGLRRWLVARCNSECPAELAVCEDDILHHAQRTAQKAEGNS